MWTLALALLPGALAQDPCSATPQDVQLAVDSALEAWSALKTDTFYEQADHLTALISCLQEPLPGEIAAEVHFVQALLARARDKDDEQVRRAVLGALAADPDFAPDPALIPPSHSVALALEEQRGAPAQGGAALAQAEDLRWYADGTERADLPLGRAVVLQRFGPGGQPPAAWYLPDSSGADLDALAPDLSAVLVAGPPGDTRASGSTRDSRLSLGFSIASGATAALAAGSLYTAWRAREAYNDYSADSPPVDAGEDLLTLNQAAGWGGYALAGVSAGLGGAALLLWDW
jgi:hypothetical protein